MIHSMTGFGRHTFSFNNKNFTIDVKSLNSKQTDVYIRIPSFYKEKELEIRNLASKNLIRGKIEIGMYVELGADKKIPTLNKDIIAKYYNQLNDISQSLGIKNQGDLLSSILRLPDVLESPNVALTKEEWKEVKNGFGNAIDECISFRKSEGEGLEYDIMQGNKQILNLLNEISPLEAERLITVKQRIKQHLKEHLEDEKRLDNNRLEQEMIFYIEKLDINEEKVRLKKHCEYFEETIKSDLHTGKKLGFITQEMGREINTLGSKSYHAEMQKIVVQMKEELEKIKEQVLNIL